MFNFDHRPVSQEAILLNMDTTTQIKRVEQDSYDGIIVTFSDGTTAGYVVEELLMLRPVREPLHGIATPAKCPASATAENSITAYA